MTSPDVPPSSQDNLAATVDPAGSPESATDLRAYLKHELSASFERRLTSGTTLPEAQRQSLTQLVRNESVTVETILGELRLRHTEASE
jgi:hypothetical protein